MKIHWYDEGRLKQYGKVSVPIPEGLEVRTFWNGRTAEPFAKIENGRLYVYVKRDKVKEAKDNGD
jgi:hypothetical protein